MNISFNTDYTFEYDKDKSYEIDKLILIKNPKKIKDISHFKTFSHKFEHQLNRFKNMEHDI